MDEDKPLLEKEDENNTECIGIRTKVVLYVVIFGCAFQISGMAEPQYIYAYLRNYSNYTEANTTTKHVSKECSDNSSTSSDDRIKGLASDWSWYMQLAEAGVALPVLIFAGPLADKIGRKPLLLWNVTISFVSFVCKTVIVYRNMNLYFYVIACGILGLSGSFYTFHLANLALLADATTKGKERSLTLTIYDTLLGIGTVSSQIGTGFLIQLVGFTYPFLITSGLVLALLIFICFTLTDTWKQNQEHSELNFQEIPGQVFSLCTNSQNVSRNLRSFLIYFCIYCLYYISLCGMFSLKTIYQLGAPFCWTSEHIGFYGAGTDFVMFITGTIALKCFHTCCLRLKDEIIAICGLVSCASCFVLFGLSTDDRMLYIATAVGILRMLPMPLLKAFLSKLVHKDKQGVLFSNVYLVEAVSKLGGSTLFNNIYEQTLTFYNGLVFFVMASFAFIAFIILVGMTCVSVHNVDTVLEVETPAIQKVDTKDD